jgi:hypothetical protein
VAVWSAVAALAVHIAHFKSLEKPADESVISIVPVAVGVVVVTTATLAACAGTMCEIVIAAKRASAIYLFMLTALLRGIWDALSRHVDSTVREARANRAKNLDWFSHR